MYDRNNCKIRIIIRDLVAAAFFPEPGCFMNPGEKIFGIRQPLPDHNPGYSGI
jgi:hypothetical protein